MSFLTERLQVQWSLVRRGLTQFQTGGSWAMALPPMVQQNLRYFFFDGFFSSASDNIILTYLTVYLLALGATQTQIGLMSSIDSLLVAALLLPGALLVERIGHRKEITIIAGGVLSRLVIVALGLVPFLIKGPELVILAIALAITRDMLANLSFPAWMSLTGDIVPIEGRGRYFSTRNIAMSAVGMLVTFLAGLILTHTAQPFGYQGAMLVAFFIGMCSTFSFSRITDPGDDASQGKKANIAVLPGGEGETHARRGLRIGAARIGIRDAIADLRTHPDFITLLGTIFVWNFSLNIAGPFFTVYLVQNLKADATMIGLTSIASTVTALVIQRTAGTLNDRWGARRLQMLSMLTIPLVPVMWVLVTQAWHVILINLLSGVLWAGFNLASFNYLLALTPSAQRARYSAIFQIAVTLAFAAGAALGSIVITHWGFHGVFILSGIGRLVAGILFWRFSKEEIPGVSQA